MSQTLIIAEKKSVAEEIAKIFGITTRKPNYFKLTNGYFISWTYGHILKLYNPKDYEQNWKKWKFQDLPIKPKKLLKKPIEDKYKKKLFEDIKTLVNQSKKIIHAGDIDREGQTIVDELLKYLNYKGITKRLLLNAVDSESIKKSFENIKNNTEYEGNYIAGQMRETLDWLYGINYTRFFTLLNNLNKKNKNIISIGRVQTPTLVLINERQNKIENFKSIEYYELTATFQKDNIIYEGSLNYNDNTKQDIIVDEENRIINKEKLETIFKNIIGEEGQISSVENNKTQKYQPLGLTLNILQSKANTLYGFTASKTLEIAQKLYEKTFITYPRTDNQYLPIEQFKDSNTILKNIKNLFKIKQELNHSQQTKIWNTKKISAHHSIIPTKVKATQLNEQEQKIYYLIAKNYLIQFLPEAKFLEIKIITKCNNIIFHTKRTEPIQMGWLQLDQTEENNQNQTSTKKLELLLLKKNDRVKNIDTKNTANNIITKHTTPPKPFTDATLITAMTNIHKYLINFDKEFDKNISSEEINILKKTKGIGTESTRASIIEVLIERNYIERKNKNILIANNGKELITLLKNNVIKETFKHITSPILTAKTEIQLQKIEKEKIGNTLYEINNEINQNLQTIKNYCVSNNLITKQQTTNNNLEIIKNKKNLIPCPCCKNGYLNTYNKNNKEGYFCIKIKNEKSIKGCNFICNKEIAETTLTKEIFISLKNDKITPKMKFKSKNNKDFYAQLIIKNKKITFKF